MVSARKQQNSTGGPVFDDLIDGPKPSVQRFVQVD